MTEIRFEAIVPKHKISAASAREVMLLMRKMGRFTQAKLQKYPPPPPASGYRRTGTLGRNWTTEGPSALGNDLVVKVGNKVKYGPYVQGLQQTRQHKKTGWPRIDKTGKEEWDKVQPEIQRALQKTP